MVELPAEWQPDGPCLRETPSEMAAHAARQLGVSVLGGVLTKNGILHERGNLRVTLSAKSFGGRGEWILGVYFKVTGKQNSWIIKKTKKNKHVTIP